MKNIFMSVAPIIGLLLAGWLIGAKLPAAIRRYIVSNITLIIWLLLFAIGLKFGKTLLSAQYMGHILNYAIVIALLTTLLPCGVVMLIYKEPRSPQVLHAREYLIPLKACALTIAMVILGALCYRLGSRFQLYDDSVRNLSTLLLDILIVVIGIDLSMLPLRQIRPKRKMLLLPLIVLVSSLAGGVLSSQILDLPLRYTLAFSSGFGWFSLSGALVGKYIGEFYGAVALLTDLLREILAIILIYALGHHYKHAVIGAGGATSLDSTLPIIKQNCGPEMIPTAVFIGFILTLLTPVLISIFLS